MNARIICLITLCVTLCPLIGCRGAADDYPYRWVSGSIENMDNTGRDPIPIAAGGAVPVAPYTVYFKKADLRFIDSLSTLNLPAEEYIKRITQQRYDVPKNLNY